MAEDRRGGRYDLCLAEALGAQLCDPLPGTVRVRTSFLTARRGIRKIYRLGIASSASISRLTRCIAS